MVPSPSFFSTSRPAREKRFAPSATSVLALPVHQIPSFYELCRRNERGESGTLVSAHLSIGWTVVQPSISPLVNKRKSPKTAKKNLLNTSSDVLLSTTLQKRGPADGNLAILDDICQQVPVIKTYQRYSEKSPEDWKNTKI